MKEYLLQSFAFNDGGNKRMLQKIMSLTDKKECLRHFSHLINSQNKWLARILQEPGVANMSWWDPVYPVDMIETEWEKSQQQWVGLLTNSTEKGLEEEVTFNGYDGGKWKAKLLDIALQLVYHSIHHRAQMQMMIREQGVEPDFIDYIGTKYVKLS